MESLIKDCIIEAITDMVNINTLAITDKSNFKYDLDMDSLEFATVITKLESTFKISIPDETMESINTVGDLITTTHNIINNRNI